MFLVGVILSVVFSGEALGAIGAISLFISILILVIWAYFVMRKRVLYILKKLEIESRIKKRSEIDYTNDYDTDFKITDPRFSKKILGYVIVFIFYILYALFAVSVLAVAALYLVSTI